ncbi:MAG TPA: histidine kinase, partial [Allocoleopsis sp.]
DSSILLRQNDANIRIKFTGLSFYSGQNFKYRYRVKELDSTWIYTVPETNYALFQSLPSGKYTFQVQLVTDDNRTSDFVSLSLSISPILWLQWWFYAIISLGASFGIFVYFKNIIRKMKERDLYFRKAVNADLEKTRAEEAYRRAQLSALKAQMNPHFLFNALNSIQAFIFLNDKNSANTYLGKFSDLMRLTLDMSQKDTVTLHDEVQMLEHYLNLEAMRLRYDLKWHIKTDSSLNIDNIQIPPLLIQPYVENAIKHGLAPKKEHRILSVFFYQKDKHSIVCEITDNGIGRQKALELKKLRLNNHKSFSTSATEQRLNLLNTGRADKIMVQYEDLVAPDGSVLGTKAIVIIPLS